MKKIILPLLFVLLFAGYTIAGDLEANSLSYDPAPVAPGSVLTVWVQVKNNSIYKAEDSIVVLETEFPFSLQSGEKAEQNIGKIAPFETATIEYKVLVDNKAIDGLHSLKVLVGEEFTTKEANFSISVLSRTPKLEIVGSSVDELSPGKVTPIILTVKNIGGSLAKNIVLKVNPDRTVTAAGVVVEREIVSLGASAKYIDKLDMDESANVKIELSVNQNAELKNYSVPITLEYFDQNGTSKTEISYLGIKVTAEADVDAVINSITPSAFPGGTSEIVVDMFNIGLADAKYVVIELSGQYMNIEEPRQFIGTLEADDFDSFKTNISFDPTTPMQEIPLTLSIYYKNDTLEEMVETKQLIVNVASSTVGGDGGIGLILIGLISLALQLIGLYVVLKWVYPRAKVFVGNMRKKK